MEKRPSVVTLGVADGVVVTGGVLACRPGRE
jgi:hypothetical protein